MRGSSGHDTGGDDFVELREIRFEEGVALVVDAILEAGGLLAVAAVEGFDDGHAFGHLAEGSKALSIQERIIVKVDKELRTARIASRTLRVGDVAGEIALGDGIVFDIGIRPDAAVLRVGGDAELNDEIGMDAEERGVVVEMMLDEIIKTVGAVGSPRT